MAKHVSLKTKKKVAVQRDDDPLTAKVLKKAADEAFREASERAMKLQGYVVIAKEGNVVKLFSDGRTEIIAPIESKD